MKYFTIKREIFLVPTTIMLEEYKKIDKFMNLLEKSNVSKIIKNVKSTDKACKGRNGYDSFNLFAAIIYCFAKFNASLRNIEDRINYDIRVRYIMEGKNPDHSTVGDFINKYIVPYQYEIFTKITKQIILELNLNISNVFIDGTKIEANANKYKFVWKPTKFHKKLDIKIKDFILKIGYGYSNKKNKFITAKEFNDILNNYIERENIIVSDIPYGRGYRRTINERYYVEGSKYLMKLVEYEEKERICGENRNSYYKTDKDATAMMLKEDYYSKLSNDFHAGYNIQVMVSCLLIVMYGVFQDRSDYYTFIPMINLYHKHYNEYPKNICADSGYGIYTNYIFLTRHQINNYVKFQQWKGESTGKRPQLFKIDENNDIYCLNNIKGQEVETNNHPKLKDGKFYIWEGCNECKYIYKCKEFIKEKNKNKNYRLREISIQYEKYKEEARKNLLSPKGIEMRINRSIQVEGTFGQIKKNMNYNRIRRRGLENVSCEIMLECLGVNIRRYLNSIEENKFKENCWNTPIDLQPEKLPTVKPK